MAKGITTFTEGDIRKHIINFAWPALITAIFSELYHVTNSLIVGNYVSVKALSAVSACGWICNIFDYGFYGLGLGAGILVARYYGAGNKDKLKESLDSSIVFGVVGGIILTFLSELCLPFLMKLCNIGPDIYNDSLNYLRVYLLGNTFVLTSRMCFFILRSFGDTKHELVYSIVSSITNLLFGVFFVRVLHLNVVGTAIATILSQMIQDILALRLLLNYDGIDFSIRNMNFSFSIIGEVCSLGIPAGIQNMLIAFSSMLVQSYTNMFSNEIIAGIGVAEKVSNWGQMICNAIAPGTMALVAQNVGAEKYERAQEAIKVSVRLSTLCTFVSVAVVWLFAPSIVGAFNPDSEVIHYGTEMIRYSIFGMIFINFSHIYNAACRGAGNVKTPMLIAVAGQVISKYLFVYIGFKITYGVRILYFGSAFGYLMAGGLASLYFNKGYWTLENKLRS